MYARTALCTLPNWRHYYDTIEHSRNSDEAFMVCRFPEWYDNSFAKALHTAYAQLMNSPKGKQVVDHFSGHHGPQSEHTDFKNVQKMFRTRPKTLHF